MQLMELDIPVVVALNKSDVNDKKNTTIDSELLSEKLGCPVVETAAVSGTGLEKVVEAAIEVTTIDLERDVLKLKEICEKTGLKMVCSTGYYLSQFHPEWLNDATVEEIAEEAAVEEAVEEVEEEAAAEEAEE